MTRAMRNLHRSAIVWLTAWAAIFAYAFAVTPSATDLFGFTWCVAFGAYSFHALRAERKGGVRA